MSSRKHKTNSFSLGAQVGGIIPPQVANDEQHLRDLMNRWNGSYSEAIREFAFLLRVDGHIHRYTKIWNIEGAQKAKRKRDWVEVEIGVPETWWQEDDGKNYKKLLVNAVEVGLRSMIELLQRNHHDIRKDALLKDWEKIKLEYLTETVRHGRDPEETKQMQKVMELIARYPNALAALARPQQKRRIQ